MNKTLDYIVEKSKKYDLEVSYLNDNTLKVYSKKYNFDSWLVKDCDETVELWHLSKKNNIKNCSYHLHAVVKRRKKLHILQKINAHYKYSINMKNKCKMMRIFDTINKKSN